MVSQSSQRIMMISTHGYVAAEPEFGKPDTGGQVVFVIELSRCLARLGYEVDILTRQFEDQPAVEAGRRPRAAPAISLWGKAFHSQGNALRSDP